MKYQYDSRIRYSQIGQDRALKLSALIDYLQDGAVFHSMHVGYGPDDTKDKQTSWMVVSWRVFAYEYPKLGDEITIETWGHNFRMAEGGRNFRITGPDGKVYVEADSRFVYVDIARQRPAACPQDEKDAYGTCEALELPETPRHVKLPENYREEEDIVVLPTHIDTNQHVNNRQYIDMALNYLPADFKSREFYVDYHTQARLGDVIHPKFYEDDSRYVISLDADNGRAYCVLEFKK